MEMEDGRGRTGKEWGKEMLTSSPFFRPPQRRKEAQTPLWEATKEEVRSRDQVVGMAFGRKAIEWAGALSKGP